MKKAHNLVAVAVGLIMSLLLISCQSNEVSKRDEAAGLNGSFETIDSGYPVNWAFFPHPETDDLFLVSVDQTKAQAGKQSVKLTTQQSEITVGLRSSRVPVEPDQTYQISFAVQNDGCSLKVRRIVQDRSGTDNRRSDIIVDISTMSSDWETYAETLLVADGEKNVVLVFLVDGPGTLWVDDVRVTKVAE
jgi:hypothetical protein